MITASALHRVAVCPASVALPQVRAVASEHAARGTVIHGFLARTLEVGRDGALEEIEDEGLRTACALIDLDRLPAVEPGAYAPEVAFAYDPTKDTARELGRNVTDRTAVYRDLSDDEIAGTADVVGVTGDAVVICDYKSGRRSVAPASENWQLALLALAAARTYGRDQAYVAVIYVRDEARPWYDAAFLDAFDLEDWAGRIRRAQANALRTWAHVHTGGTPSVVEGDHCHHCPAFTNCPAKTRLMLALAAEPGAIVSTTPQPITNELAATAYRRLKLIKEAVEQVQGQIYAHAAESGGIDLGDGVWLGPKKVEREEVDGAVARQVLLERFGQLVADRAASWEVTKASVKKAAQSLALERGSKVAPVERELLDAIREAGGVQVRHSAPIKEHRR